MKPRLRPQGKAVGGLVRGDLHRPRDEPIHRVRLVIGARHQRRKGHVHALRALALQDIGVERVEGKERLVERALRGNEREHSPFRRVDIDIVEMMKIGRIFQIAEHRDAVNIGAGIGRPGRRQQRRAQRADTETEHMPAGEPRPALKAPQDRLPILAAFSASHHHSVGKPEMPYFGSGSAWLKRSQRA